MKNYFLMVLCLFCLNVFGQISPRNSNTPGASNKSLIVPSSNSKAIESFSFSKNENTSFGRSSYEIISINLIKKRTNGDGEYAPSLPFDVPFYLEGDVSKDVNRVYAIALPKVKCKYDYDIISTLETIISEYESIQKSRLNTSDKNTLDGNTIYTNSISNCTDCMENNLFSNMINERIIFDDWADRKAVAGIWESANFDLLREKDVENSFSVLMPALDSGTEYEIFFALKKQLSTKEKDELKKKGISNLFKILHAETKASKRDAEYLRDKNRIHQILARVHFQLKPEIIKSLRKYNLRNDVLESRYSEAREKFYSDFKNATIDYLNAINELHSSDKNLDNLEFEIIRMKSSINCSNFKRYLSRIELVDENGYGYSNLKGIALDDKGKETEFLDDITRRKNIYKLLKNLKNDTYNVCNITSCCNSNEEIDEFHKLLDELKKTLYANLKIVNDYSNAKSKYINALSPISETLIDSLIPSAGIISVNSDSHGTFESRTGSLIIPEFGVMLSGKGEYGARIRPSFGLNFHFAQVNREKSYGIFNSSGSKIRFLKSFSFSTGFTFLNDFNSDRREGIIHGLPVTFYAGIGIRVNDFLRLGIGKNIMRQADENVLRNNTRIYSEPYVQISIDFSASEFFNNIFGWIL